MNLQEKVALITGASSGIGKACAHAFAKEGSFLSITGRQLEVLNKVKEECAALGLPTDKILVIQADVGKDGDLKRIVDSTISHFGTIDVLVNNAGILIRGSLEEVSMEGYDQQMNINTRSPLLLTKLCLPHLIKSKGNVVNVSSIAGPKAFINMISYAMSKAAMDQFTKCLALELASKGVRVNAVNPGVIVTDIHKRAGMDLKDYEKFLEHSKTTHALGRVGEVEEVANAVLFLASDKSSFTTGHLLPVDGGRGIMTPR